MLRLDVSFNKVVQVSINSHSYEHKFRRLVDLLSVLVRIGISFAPASFSTQKPYTHDVC